MIYGSIVMALGLAWAVHGYFVFVPNRTAHAAMLALQRYDSKSLCELSAADELRNLGINSGNVQSFLAATIAGWTRFQIISITPHDGNTPDTKYFNIELKASQTRLLPRIWVYEAPDGTWKLGISETLRSLAQASANTFDMAEARTFNDTLMKKLGIRGVWSPKRGFEFLPGMTPTDNKGQ